MRGYTVLLTKEITEQWRTGRLLVLAVIFVLFGLASPVLAKYTPDIVKLAASSIDIHLPTPSIKDAVAQLIKTLSQVGILTAILLAMGSVAGEKESGTAAFVLVKPVGRFAFLAAKFSGLTVTYAAPGIRRCSARRTDSARSAARPATRTSSVPATLSSYCWIGT